MFDEQNNTRAFKRVFIDPFEFCEGLFLKVGLNSPVLQYRGEDLMY